MVSVVGAGVGVWLGVCGVVVVVCAGVVRRTVVVVVVGVVVAGCGGFGSGSDSEGRW